MFLWLWKNMRGYVRIEVTGFSTERFINMAAHKGIYLWDVVHMDTGVLMNVSIKGFKMLRECLRKTKCKMRIRQKKGLPFVIYKYRKRKILMGGIIFCAAILYLLSCFVWMIDIKGNDRVSRDEIVAFCANKGLQIGAFKYKIDNKKLKSDLMNHFKDVSWLDVHIKGTRAIIQIAEIIPPPEIVDKSTPSHVVALKDGLITSIVAGSGDPLVKKDDVVHKGDVLVSGLVKTLTDDGGEMIKTVHAYAEVWAKMYNEINFAVPFQYEDKSYTGKHASQYAITVMGYTFNLFRIGPEMLNFDRFTKRTQLNFGENYPLPVIIFKHTYRDFTPITLTRTVDEAKELAGRMINSRIIREFDFAADIIDKSVAIQELPDQIIVNALITTNERIDKEVPLDYATEVTDLAS
jgi:similar to stage IV sporulation protein